MGEINLTDSEKDGLKAIDERELDGLIDQALREEHSGALHRLPLSSCGPYVATKLHYFSESLKEYRDSRSVRKREDKHFQARRAGSDLSFTFGSMKRRMEVEEREGQLFHVDDHIHWPYRFTKNLQITISYRWRRTVEEAWTHGSIEFHHEVHPHLCYALPRPKRKPSAAKQAQNLQDELSRTWEHFMRLALYSVRDYFRNGGDGREIPES
ncbi:hypothetical protein NKH84_24060 [Mesorhizobium sp. M0902]|uniref:hypothetical protein n=1 Tax=unclassified Mesorhizobium TaxID=325217 RepID=UPI0033359BE0